MEDENPHGAAAEEFLWSLGVGQALPDWLKELRRRERAEGKNQLPAASCNNIGVRPGHGPQPDQAKPWDGNNSVMVSSTLGSDKPFTKEIYNEEQRNPRVPYEPASIPKSVSSTQPASGQLPIRASSHGQPAGVMPEPEEQPPYPCHSEPQLRELQQNVFTISPAEECSYGSSPHPFARMPPQTSQVAPSAKIKRFDMPFQVWLAELDESGFLNQYNDVLVQTMGDIDHIVDNYVNAGVLDPSFFQIAGIKKLGHKRMFEKWFRDNCKND